MQRSGWDYRSYLRLTNVDDLLRITLVGVVVEDVVDLRRKVVESHVVPSPVPERRISRGEVMSVLLTVDVASVVAQPHIVAQRGQHKRERVSPVQHPHRRRLQQPMLHEDDSSPLLTYIATNTTATASTLFVFLMLMLMLLRGRDVKQLDHETIIYRAMSELANSLMLNTRS